MRQPTFVGSSITTRGGDAKVHGRMLPVAPIELAELLLGASQADLETFDLAEPAFRLGFGSASAGCRVDWHKGFGDSVDDGETVPTLQFQ